MVPLMRSVLLSPQPEHPIYGKLSPNSSRTFAAIASGQQRNNPWEKPPCISSKQRRCFANVAGCILHSSLFSEYKQMLYILLIISGYCIILLWCQAIRGSKCYTTTALIEA